MHFSRNSPAIGGRRWLSRCLTLALLATTALAERAEVHLRDGTTLRGDVDFTETEVVVRNAAGEVRYPRAAVARVERLEAPATVDADYAWSFRALAADDLEGHFALAEYLNSRERYDLLARQAEYILGKSPEHRNARLLLDLALEKMKSEQAPATDEGDEQEPAGTIPPPPLLTREEIQRIRLSEYATDGIPEVLQLRFLRRPGQKSLEDTIVAQLRAQPEHDPRWIRTLERGRAHEQLQIVLRVSGLEHADRIELKSELHKFEQFRRSVLPLLIKGCARAGCHGGASAESFRFPRAAKSSDPFVFTTFVMFDRMSSRVGPMIDRAAPEQSALLKFLIPAPEDRAHPHPDVSGRFKPLLRSDKERDYRAVADWIRSLKTPRPDYGLQLDLPGAAPAASQPASLPAVAPLPVP